MAILKLEPDLLAELKKPHPCGGKIFRVIRVGSLCRVRCERCGHDLEIDRVKLEKAVRRILSKDETC